MHYKITTLTSYFYSTHAMLLSSSLPKCNDTAISSGRPSRCGPQSIKYAGIGSERHPPTEAIKGRTKVRYHC